MENLVHLIYPITATSEMSQSQLYELFSKSSLNNQEREVTGLLLYVEGNFLQVIEGDEKNVVALYKKIMNDPRHTNSKRILVERIEHRNFGYWGMGFAGITKEELQLIDGLNDFFSNEQTIHSIDEKEYEKC